MRATGLAHLAVAAVLLVSSTAGLASPRVLKSRACPALFGDEVVRRRNHENRLHFLHWIHQEPTGITVAHSRHRWDTPVPLRVFGLELIETTVGAAPHAVLKVSPPLASIVGCAAGRYRISMDDGISPRLRVLAVLRGLLLLDRGGRLGYIAASGTVPPSWLMAWRVRGTLTPGTGSRQVAPAPRPPPRRR